jgi:tyrosyl-tRNA synthetase
VTIARARLEAGIPVYEALREAGLAASNGEARRLIRGGGARLNDAAIADENRSITLADITGDGHIKLSAGKKRHALLRAG